MNTDDVIYKVLKKEISILYYHTFINNRDNDYVLCKRGKCLYKKLNISFFQVIPYLKIRHFASLRSIFVNKYQILTKTVRGIYQMEHIYPFFFHLYFVLLSFFKANVNKTILVDNLFYLFDKNIIFLNISKTQHFDLNYCLHQ